MDTIWLTAFIITLILSLTIHTTNSMVLCPPQCTCITGTVNTKSLEVRCRQNSLTKLPQRLPYASSYRLIFAHNNIETLASRPYLDSTDHLDISNNKIKNVSRNAINQLQHRVRYLYLHGNNIDCLPLATQDHFHLHEITLHNNPWNCTCIKTLMGLLKSEHVDVQQNKISCVNSIEREPHKIIVKEDNSLFDELHHLTFMKSPKKTLSERDGFLAFLATLVSIAVIFIAIGVLYLYKCSKDRKEMKRLQEEEESSDQEQIL